MGSKKKTPRSQVKHPGFIKRYNPKVNQEYMDIDYLDKLNEQEKEWLHKFEEEFNGASLDFKNLENNLHNTQELKKDCTDRKNARNRCTYGIAKANGLVRDDPRIENNRIHNDSRIENNCIYDDPSITEDAMISYIDKKNED